MVLGMFDSVPYADGSVEIAGGDTLLIFSDGVTETLERRPRRRSRSNGLSEIAPGARARRGVPPVRDPAPARLLLRGAKATDDRTLIVLKRA